MALNQAMINSLSEKNRLLLAETETAALRTLSEDELLALQDRVRRSRDKYVSVYRRKGAAKTKKKGGRGLAKEANRRNADRAEVFEDALARVSTALAAAARRTARELRGERLAAARAAKASATPRKASTTKRASAVRSAGPAASRRPTTAGPDEPIGDRSTRSPASVKRKASTTAATARRQAKRDGR